MRGHAMAWSPGLSTRARQPGVPSPPHLARVMGRGKRMRRRSARCIRSGASVVAGSAGIAASHAPACLLIWIVSGPPQRHDSQAVCQAPPCPVVRPGGSNCPPMRAGGPDQQGPHPCAASASRSALNVGAARSAGQEIFAWLKRCVCGPQGLVDATANQPDMSGSPCSPLRLQNGVGSARRVMEQVLAVAS